MQKKHLLLFLIFISLSDFLPAQQSPLHCGSTHLLEERKKENPDLAKQILQLETQLQEQMGKAQFRERNAIIPVVVHVVWVEQADNISDEVIQSQIDALNRDFQRRNENRLRVPEDFAPLMANIGFEFCLAGSAPDGTLSSGITRTQSILSCIGNTGSVKVDGKPRLFYTALGGADAWDTEHYLNIWVAPNCDAFLGSSSFPGIGPAEEDGVSIDPQYLGVFPENSAAFPFHLGKTLTHEVGHYFNLQHTWGSSGCDTDDLVADTPAQEKAYQGCPIHPSSTCDSPDMFMNFMNYVDDECLMFFTQGQKERMLATLAGPRAGLLDNDFCNPKVVTLTPPLSIYPNPARDCIHVVLKEDQTEVYEVLLYDAAGKIVAQQEGVGGIAERINTHFLASGIYFIQAKMGGSIYTGKVLVLPEAF